MRALLSEITANTTGQWTRFNGGPSPVEVVLQVDGLTEGADNITVEVRYEGNAKVFKLASFTGDGGLVATPAGSYSSSFGSFELRAVLADAQAETNVTVIAA